jgi:hypothetical protein
MRHYTRCGGMRRQRRRWAKTADGLPDLSIAPPLPPVYRAGDDREPAVFEWLGFRAEIPLRHAGSNARSDQVLAFIDGAWRLTNMTAVARLLVKMVPRQPSKALQAEWDFDAAMGVER